jgi:hypothetical protein
MSGGDPRDREGRIEPVGDAALVDLVDRLLAGGVVLAGDVTIALADVDLVHVSLRALISSVETIESGRRPW